MPEPDVSNLMSVAEAIEILDKTPVSPRIIHSKLEHVQGLRLARDLRADRDSPPFDKSQMDGYAVRARDVAGERIVLRCIAEIAAGNEASQTIGAGECAAIMTGAPMPPGTDAVVPVEMRRSIDGDRVTLQGPAEKGKFISPRGSEWRGGDILLQSGVELEAAQLALAATVGAAEIDVFARPRVALLATGDEIVPIDQVPGPSQIRNSNSTMLAALLRRLGCDVTNLGKVVDDREQIRKAIVGGMEHGVLFITGGMSMGQHDYVPKVLQDLDVELRITKLRIKPGKPFIFGVKGNGIVFGLPGNPVSGFACTLRLCSRLLARLAGGKPQDRFISAALSEAIGPNGPREFYQPAVLQSDAAIVPLAWKSSADLLTLAKANVLLVRPENDPAQPAGSIVRALEIPT